MAKISVTRALTQLKTLDDRIKKSLQDVQLIDYVKGQSTVCALSKVDEKQFAAAALAWRDRVFALIDRYTAVKFAVTLSNAGVVDPVGVELRRVDVAGRQYTVAEAIEYKRVIGYWSSVWATLRTEYQKVLAKFEREQETNIRRLDELLKSCAGTAGTERLGDAVASVTEAFKVANDLRLVDPLNLGKLVDEVGEHLTSFEEVVDVVLSEENARTYVEVPD